MSTTEIFPISWGGTRQRGGLDKGFYGSYLFSPSFLIPFNDGFVISSWTSYYGSGLGVSLISSLDRTLIKFDSQRNIDWITSFDFDNQIDNTSNMELFDNTIYLAWPIGLGDHYYWISTVYLTTGEVKIACISYSKIWWNCHILIWSLMNKIWKFHPLT